MSCKILTPADFDSRRVQRVESSSSASPGIDREQAERLRQRILELEQQCGAGAREAREQGFRDGEASGRKQTESELEAILDRVSSSLGEIATLRSKIRRETEQELVSLSIAIAKRVIYRELSVDPDAIQGLIKAALEKVQTKDICRIRLHPEHARQASASPARLGFPGESELVADASLSLGSIVVETRRGDLDCSIDTQLKEIERGFADRIAR